MSEVTSAAVLSQASASHSGTRAASVFISWYICTLTVVGFLMASDQFIHWFIAPVLCSGVLIGIDAVDWLLGHRNVFDPISILGLLGFHFFFLAPLLHVYWDTWMTIVVPPPDWRDWLGGMAVLNLLGIVVYRIARGAFNTPKRRSTGEHIWLIDQRKFSVIIKLALVGTFLLQLWVYRNFGGISGYIQAYRDAEVNQTGGFQGMGWIFTLSESFPILALVYYVVYAKNKNFARSWLSIALVLVAFFVLKMLFGGLRGSRSNTILGLFWAVGIIHFWIRPISKKVVLVGCIFLVLFMYFYGFYKSAGLDGLSAFTSSTARAELTERTGRSLETMLLADLGRSDTQAYVLYRLSSPDSDYQYAWGRTYLGAAALLIPRAVWPDRPPTIVKEGTDILFGMGSYIPIVWQSSLVYGWACEALLNFGVVAVPFAFLSLAWVVGRIKYMMQQLRPDDSRQLLLPFLINLCFIILVSDSDEILFFLIKDGAVPFLIIILSSTRRLVVRSEATAT